MRGDNCYVLVSQAMTFSKANKYCRSIGAYLPEPSNENENDILHNFMKNMMNSSIKAIWLGATDSANEGTWIWQSAGQGLSYHKWRPGNTNQENKDCSCFFHDGLWTYCTCNRKLYSICQKKLGGNVNVLLSSSFKNIIFT